MSGTSSYQRFTAPTPKVASSWAEDIENKQLKMAIKSKDKLIEHHRLQIVERYRKPIVGTGEERETTDQEDTVIIELKRKIKELEDEVEMLKQELQKVNDKLSNTNLQLAKVRETTDQEDTVIITLKWQIKELEDEVEMLKQELEMVKDELCCTNTELKTLQTKDEQRQLQLANVEGDLQDTTKELKTLQKKDEQRQLQLAKVEGDLEDTNKKLKTLQGDQNTLILGEMCRRLQENFFRFVFLDNDEIYINSKLTYKVKYLEDEINNNEWELSEAEKKTARERLKKLKKHFHWNFKKERLVYKIQNLRNVKAHPEFTGDIKQKVLNAVEELSKEKLFKSMKSSSKDAKELVEIWEESDLLAKGLKNLK